MNGEILAAITTIIEGALPPGSRVTAETDFHGYQLSSLAAVRVRLEIRRIFAVELSMAELVSLRTASALARHVAARGGARTAVICKSADACTEASANSAGAFLPFDLTEIQQSYIVGKETAPEEDRFGCNIYREFPIRQFRADHLRDAWARLVDCHDALRLVVTPDGRQRVQAEAGRWALPVKGAFRESSAELMDRLEEVRTRIGHRRYAVGEWPLFDIEASVLETGDAIIHFSIDGCITDGHGLALLLMQWAACYRDPSHVPTRVSLPLRNCVQALARRGAGPQCAVDLDYWTLRLSQVPPGPGCMALQSVPLASVDGILRRQPFDAVLSDVEWRALQRRAAALDVTPTALILTVFAETLARLFAEPRFTLLLTTNNRPWLPREAADVVGPLSGSLPFVIDETASVPFEEAAKNLHRRLWEDLEHASVDGVAALRAVRRVRRETASVPLPVVFTSMLDALPTDDAAEGFAPAVTLAMSETSGVHLDHQVWERQGRLHLHWDVAAAAFPAGKIETAFAIFCNVLRSVSATATEDRRPLNELQKAYLVTRAGTEGASGGCQAYQSFFVHKLDVGRLELAWTKMIRAYECLRTVVTHDGCLKVLPEPQLTLRIPVIDLSSAADAAGCLGLLRDEMVSRAFSIGRWPMFDLRITRDRFDSAIVHIAIDLIIADGLSIHFLFRELFRQYADPAAQLPVGKCVGEYLSQREELRTGIRHASWVRYWQQRFEGIPGGPALPTAARMLAETGRIRLEARFANWPRLRELARTCGFAPDMILLAALTQVFHDELCAEPFSVPVVRWTPAESEYRPGEFTTLGWVTHETPKLPLLQRAAAYQASIDGDPPSVAVSGLAELRKVVMKQRRTGAFAMPLVYTSVLELSRWPLPADVRAGPGITHTPDVSIDCIALEDEEGLQVCWDAVKSHFPAGKLDAMFAGFQRALASLDLDESEELPGHHLESQRRTDRPQIAHSKGHSVEAAELAVAPLSEAARQVILSDWNDTRVEFAGDRPAHLLFEDHVHARPNAFALRGPAGSRTYSQLNQEANRIAWALKELGVEAETVVGICLRRTPLMVSAVLGVAKAGGAYLPIDPAMPRDRIAFILRQAGASILLTSADDRPGALDPHTRVLELDRSARTTPRGNPPWTAGTHNTAYVIFTSGSTGTPKGVQVPHRSLLNLLNWCHRTFRFGPTDIGLGVASLAFDLSVFDIFGLLSCGATLYLADETQRKDPTLLMNILLEEQITFWNSAPTVLHQLSPLLSAHINHAGTRHLRLAFLSGDFIPMSLPDAVRAAFANVTVVNLGGATEATVWSNYYIIAQTDPTWRSIPYGKPIDNARYHVLDAGLEPCPVGVEGDLHIGGECLAVGYYNLPELTANAFIPDPFSPRAGDRLYRTGDRAAYLPDGNLTLLGRIDEQVKLHGHRIELTEIEHRLRSHPAVKDALVLMRNDDSLDQKLVAYVIPTSGTQCSISTLRAHAAAFLPAYMVPNSVCFVSSFPATPNGKLDRSGLPWPISEKAAHATATDALATDALTAEVVGLCAELLNVAKIDVHQDLWDQGASSFTMVQISNRLQARYGCRVPVSVLLEEPTVAGIVGFLAKQLRHAATVATPTITASLKAGVQTGTVDLLDSEAVVRFRSEHLNIRRSVPDEALVALDCVEVAPAWYDCRMSRREFADGQVLYASFCRLLTLLRQEKPNGQPRYLYPSAGSTYAVQTYVHVKPKAVEGIGPGLYYYDPTAHVLRLLDPAPRFERTDHFIYNRAIFDRAGFCLFLIGQMKGIEPLYQDQSERFLLLEAGYIGQLLMLGQTASRVGLCPFGSMNFDRVRGQFRLDDSHRFLHGFYGGADAPQLRLPAVFGAPEEPRDVAVIGMACRLPGADGPDAFWQLLAEGKCTLRRLPEGRKASLPTVEAPVGGFLEAIDGFDSLLFGISPAEARLLDPQLRFLLQSVWECVEDAGYTAQSLRRSVPRVGVFVAAMWHDYQHVGADEWRRGGAAAVAATSSDIANRISHFFGFEGPSVAVDTSCASFLTAMHLAAASLHSCDCDVAIVAAVNLVCHPYHIGLLSNFDLLASNDQCWAFDQDATGWHVGEGGGALLLRPLVAARQARDVIHGVVEDTWIAHSGAAARFANPAPKALAKSIADGLRRAHRRPEEVSYVECAAAGAGMADAAELEALAEIFGASKRSDTLRIGTLKPNIGHLEAASGLSQVLKVLLQMRYRQIAPTLLSRNPTPLIAWETTPFSVAERLDEWRAGSDGKVRALVNALGAGGSFAHAVLRSADPPVGSDVQHTEPFVIPLSAATRPQLQAQGARLRDYVAARLEGGTAPSVADIAFTLQTGRTSMEHRLVASCSDAEDLLGTLDAFLRDEPCRNLQVGSARPQASTQAACAPTPAEAASKWLQGHAVDWGEYWIAKPAQKLSLPTYPFAPDKSWLAYATQDEESQSAESSSVPAALQTEAEDYLKRAYAQVSEIAVSRLDAHVPLDRYGLNSRLVAQLNSILARDLGPVSRTLFFEYSDLAGIAAHLIERHADFWKRRKGQSNSAASRARALPASVHRAASTNDDIAIIGMAGRFPLAANLREFWRNLAAGRDCIRQLPAARRRPGWPIELMWAGFLDDVDCFDPSFFNITPRDAELMDPQERIFLEVAWETLEDAGYGRGRLKSLHGSECGVFVGSMYNEYPFFGVESSLRGARVAAGSALAGIANRVSYFLDARGPSMTVDTMCSSSLTCIHLAVESLRRAECQLAIAGGVNLCLHPNKFIQLDQLHMAARGHRCRSFGAGGDGFVAGEGAGAVLLKPLSDALRDGDRIHALIKGTAINHGGKTSGYLVPNPVAQGAVVATALQRAGVEAESLGYIEAHGTGTQLGDPIELNGLSRAFADAKLPPGSCAIGSAKSSIGHLEAAAGVAGLAKLVLQMQHRWFAPSLHADRLNYNIDWEHSPFRVQREAAPWPSSAPTFGTLRSVRGGVSSFGAGGANAHVIVEAYEAQERAPQPPSGPQLIILSARDEIRLRALASRLADFVAETGSETLDLADVAYTLQVGREAFQERLAVVVTDLEVLRSELQAFARRERSEVVRGRAVTSDDAHRDCAEEDEIAVDVGVLARRWVAGQKVNWSRLPRDRPARIVSLPSYPFARVRCWVEEALAQVSAEDFREPPIQRKTWTSADPAVRQERAGTVVCLFNPASEPVARALVEILGGDRVLLVAESADCADDVLAYGEDADAQRLRDLARTRGPDIGCWVDLCDLYRPRGTSGPWTTRLLALQEVLLNLRGRPLGLVHVTQGLLSSGGPPPSLAGARMAGFVRAIGAEHRVVAACTLDSDIAPEDPQKLVEQILTEWGQADPCAEVCYRDGQRLLARLVDVDEGVVSELRPDPTRVYVITGGTRGIGALVARHLVERGARKLALVSAHAVPPRPRWQDRALGPKAKEAVATVRDLESLGATVMLHAGTLAQTTALDNWLQDVRRSLGEIDGVIHAAGIRSRASAGFARTPLADLRAVAEPKIEGLETLAALTRHDRLSFFVLFSSASAVLPGLAAGVADYSAANAFMDLFANYQARIGQSAFCSIGWPAWRARSGDSLQAEACERAGLASIETAQAMRVLDRVLSLPARGHVAVLPPLPDCGRPQGQSGSKWQEAPSPSEPQPHVVDLPDPEVGTEHRSQPAAWLLQLFSETLRTPTDELDATAEFGELGVESVMLGTLLQKIENYLGRPLAPATLLEHATLERLSRHLEQVRRPNAIAAAALPPPSARREDDYIAIIGMAGRLPGAADLRAFWDNLAAGRCAVTEVPNSRWDVDRFYSPRGERGKSISKWGGYLSDIDMFDPGFFHMDDEQAVVCDPAIRLFLECVATALRDAGYADEELSGRDVGVFAGARMSNYRLALKEHKNGEHKNAHSLGGDQNFIAAWAAHHFNFQGPNVVVDSACSSALTALYLACQNLRAGECELALAGGVEFLFDEESYVQFTAAGALSPTGRCAAFDQSADGFVPGEGCGVVLLKPLAKALANGDRIHAVIRSIAITNDGATMGLTTPNPAAQAKAIRRALVGSGLDVHSVAMIEAHGTGTMLGDPIELRALTQTFRQFTDRRQFCAIGSVKSSIGHLFSAAGMAGLLKVVLALQHHQIPPTLFCETPNPRFDFETSPFYPATALRPWPATACARAAGVSAFGLGGTNVHVIVSECDPTLRSTGVRAPLPAPMFNRRPFWLERIGAGDTARVVLPQPSRRPAKRDGDGQMTASILDLDFSGTGYGAIHG